MKLITVKLPKSPNSSFIYNIEHDPFSLWHYHPEYELVLITKGKGKRMVGDNISRFKENDLVFVGSKTPHEWLCDSKYFTGPNGFWGEGFVIQFQHDFLGQDFLKIPENRSLQKFLNDSARGFQFFGESKRMIISIMLKMRKMNDIEKLYALFSIFQILETTDEIKILSSPAFIKKISLTENQPMQRAMQFIIQNFQNQIQIKDLLKITNMSNTAFYSKFKATFKMTFKNYLLNLRVGYTCKLLTEDKLNISEIAYTCGFENISNFNRQFKKIRGITPSEFQKNVHSLDVIPVEKPEITSVF